MTGPRPIALMVADTHLAPGAWTHRDIQGDAHHSFARLVEYAIRHKVPNILAAGDLLDVHRPRSSTVEWFRVQMDRLEQHGVGFFFIQGQHEKADPPWCRAAHNWPTHTHEMLRDISRGRSQAIQTYSIDFQPAGELQEALKKIPKGTDLLMVHQTWHNFMGGQAACQGDLAEIPYAKLVLTGDLHKFDQRKLRGAADQAMTVVSPGSTAMQSIDEPSTKYFLVLYEDLSFDEIKIPTRLCIRYGQVTTTEELDNFLSNLNRLLSDAEEVSAELPEELRKPLMHIPYSVEVSNVVARIEKQVGIRAHLFFKPLIPSTEAARGRRESSEEVAKLGLAGMLEKRVRKGSKLYGACARLLECRDVREELGTIRKELLEPKEM